MSIFDNMSGATKDSSDIELLIKLKYGSFETCRDRREQKDYLNSLPTAALLRIFKRIVGADSKFSNLEQDFVSDAILFYCGQSVIAKEITLALIEYHTLLGRV